MAKKVVIALGGNALVKKGERGTIQEQLSHVRETTRHIVEIIQERYQIVITHGNGPQVGDLLLKNEMTKDSLPSMPLDICGAETQGMIGYMIQRYIVNHLKCQARCFSLDIPVVTVMTQTLVERDDPAFSNPSKPIGPYYSASEAETLQREKTWTMVEQPGGFRRVVPSPAPVDLVESAAIKKLFSEGMILVAAGGGGVPVVKKEDGTIHGVEGVVDKDHTAVTLARILDADILLILTAVEKVALHFGKPDEKLLDTLSVSDAKKYLAAGEFPPGSMGPKVKAAIQFVEEGGEKAIITSLEHGKDALKGKAGTTIC